MLTLGLLYEPDGGPLLSVASTGDQRLVRQVAKAILAETDARAEKLGRRDPFLGEAQRAEGARLRRLLGMPAKVVF